MKSSSPAAEFERSISAQVRRRVAEGWVESGSDIVAIRRFVDLTAVDFARVFGITLEPLLGRRGEAGAAAGWG